MMPLTSRKTLFGREAEEIRKKLPLQVIGILILVFSIILPTPDGLSLEGKYMIGILLMGAFFWATEALPVAVTALLVMILQPLLGVLGVTEVFQSFGNQAVFFLIGAFILAVGVEKHNLHKRIALLFLSRFESSPKRFTFGIMLTCALLSFIIPEHAVAVLMLPIILSILMAMDLIPKQSNFGKVCMLSIAFGCSIGSLGTLIGGARNPLTIGFLQETAGVRISFLEWMIYSMPIVFLSLPIVWLILVRTFPIELKSLERGKKEIYTEVKALGPMGKNEHMVLGILCFTIFLWVTLSTELSLAVIALLGGVLLVASGTINWKDVEKRVPWGVVLLYGGAITLGVGMLRTGAAEWSVGLVLSGLGRDPYLVLLFLIVTTIFITELMSNTAAVAVMLPIGMGFALEITELNVLVTSLSIALSGGLAFVLVVATPSNAITYSSGYYSSKDLFRSGLVANIPCIFIIFMIALTYWRFIGVW